MYNARSIAESPVAGDELGCSSKLRERNAGRDTEGNPDCRRLRVPAYRIAQVDKRQRLSSKDQLAPDNVDLGEQIL